MNRKTFISALLALTILPKSIQGQKSESIHDTIRKDLTDMLGRIYYEDEPRNIFNQLVRDLMKYFSTQEHAGRIFNYRIYPNNITIKPTGTLHRFDIIVAYQLFPHGHMYSVRITVGDGKSNITYVKGEI